MRRSDNPAKTSRRKRSERAYIAIPPPQGLANDCEPQRVAGYVGERCGPHTASERSCRQSGRRPPNCSGPKATSSRQRTGKSSWNFRCENPVVSQFEIRLSAMLERTLRRPERLNSLRQWAVTPTASDIIRHKRTSPTTLVRSGNRMMFVRYGPLTIDFAQADRQAKI
jgi:hypothetical protein